MATWKSGEARTKLSDVIRETLTEGPQLITRRGKETVVFVSVAEWYRLLAQAAEPSSKAQK